ncbi:BrnA antitoxin family protein [Sphingomonas sp. PB2P12]|uniref:BrnA antitoxin family protein n=1 Tax=Sphingomonas sandaracina TaxID=3096157 RepID=UPI002FC8CA7A
MTGFENADAVRRNGRRPRLNQPTPRPCEGVAPTWLVIPARSRSKTTIPSGPKPTSRRYARSPTSPNSQQPSRTAAGRAVGRKALSRPASRPFLHLDNDVLERFRTSGPGWQSRINVTLRAARI